MRLRHALLAGGGTAAAIAFIFWGRAGQVAQTKTAVTDPRTPNSRSVSKQPSRDAATSPNIKSTAPTASSSTTSTIPIAQRAKRTVRIEIKPIKNAAVVITGPDGIAQAVTSPAVVQVPEGDTTIRSSTTGWADLNETLTVSTDITITRWLNPPGQLHHKHYETKTGSNPKQVTFTPDSKEMWVTLLGSRGMQVFETATGKLTNTIVLGDKGGAVEVVFTKDGKRAYASQMETASVYEVDTATKQVLRQFATEGSWTKILAFPPDEKTLYAANWSSNDVSVIDLEKGATVKRIKTVRTPRGVVISPDGMRMFVAGFDGGEIQRIDLATEESKVLFSTGGAMRHMSYDEKTNRIYADDMGKAETYTIDLNTETVSTLSKTDSHPNTMDLSPDGRFLYVSNRGENGRTYSVPGPEWGSVLVIDTTTGKTVDAMVGGNQPTGLDVSPDGKLLAFTDFLDNRLTVLSVPSAEVLAASTGGFSGPHRAFVPKTKGAKGKVPPFAGE
jgi:YVTN family beta-propeller protein